MKNKEFKGNLEKADFFNLLLNEDAMFSFLSHSQWKFKIGIFFK